MTDDRTTTEEGRVDPWRPSWPPSPRTQIILIGAGFFLLNLMLIIAFGIVLYLLR